MFSKIFDINISQLSLLETTEKALSYLKKPGRYHIVTANSEMIYLTLKDNKLKNILQNADMVTPDGIGTVWAAKQLSEPVKERVAGFDLFMSLLENGENIKVFLFGASSEVVNLAANKISKEYDNVKLVGWQDGFFDDDSKIIHKINSSQPDIIFVALGCPKQEYWISDNLENLNVKLALGVGGSFDVIAGKVKRAPELWQKLGLEWAYRLLKEPSRFIRMLALPRFVVKVLLEKYKKKD